MISVAFQIEGLGGVEISGNHRMCVGDFSEQACGAMTAVEIDLIDSNFSLRCSCVE